MTAYGEKVKEKQLVCYHCGEFCRDNSLSGEDKVFCCLGCKTIFEILNTGNLCQYYSIDKNPGISQKNLASGNFDFLEDNKIQNSLMEFSDNGISIVTFFIPSIHCSSCIWLLENLFKLNSGVLNSEVNFLSKKVRIRFNNNIITLRQVAELLESIGYIPQLNLDVLDSKHVSLLNKGLYYKLGIAGFCFGNIMLFSFPEYLGFDEAVPSWIFSVLNIVLSLPVFFYCASDYFRSALAGLKEKFINIDFPISLGLLVLFVRSLYEIISQTGPGFLDSMSGLIFLLLAGKMFQTKTYDALNFERNYRSYFPLSVTVIKNGKESSAPVTNLKAGDRILIRNNEIIPVDGILFRGSGNIDYSFVTGESVPVDKVLGEILYAGGRQLGSAIEIEVIRTVSQSYLTQLWNSNSFTKDDEKSFISMVNKSAKYFTILIILLAIAAAYYWYPAGISGAIYAFTAVLIIACPCGLALTSPFALGNALRILSKNKFYLKNGSVIEKLSKINTVIFDKTGTITVSGIGSLEFSGRTLTEEEKTMIGNLVRNSYHPLSRIIYGTLACEEIQEVSDFNEIPGSGISCVVNGNIIKLGSYLFVMGGSGRKDDLQNTKVHLSVNGDYYGYFTFVNNIKKGFNALIKSLRKKFSVVLLSGDNENQRSELTAYFDFMHFEQTPEDKMNYVKELQAFGHNVVMVGDGLNDAGALKQSNAGIVISDDVTGFSPASDGILDSDSFHLFAVFINYAFTVKKIIITSFIISALYNIAGIYFAFIGSISPFFAAVLMPVSSVTVILFTVLSTSLFAKTRGLRT